MRFAARIGYEYDIRQVVDVDLGLEAKVGKLTGGTKAYTRHRAFDNSTTDLSRDFFAIHFRDIDDTDNSFRND